MSLLSVMVMSLPLQAQVVIDNTEQETKEEEPADDKDELAVSDSLMVDSLASDSLPWPHAVQVGLDNLLKSKMFETSQVGIMVWDLEADSCIYRVRERQWMRPASTMKLVTAITALDKLGGSYQFKTTLKYTGTVENGVLKGDIYCVGGMDPRFNTDDMTAFVTSLKELGVDSIQGSVYADRSMKDEDLLGEGWCWDDDNPVLSPLVFGRKDLFMDRFLSKLKDAGIFYAGFGASVKRCPQGAFTICTRFHTMDQILHKMMKESDNLYAESMYYQIAASTLYNYLSAELEVKLLRYAYRDENMYQQLKQSLPIAGVDGTLKKRMKTGYAHANVKAKTGTLTGIISLAGYCKAANGHELCFSIINNGIMHGNNARNFADKVCELLCKP